MRAVVTTEAQPAFTVRELEDPEPTEDQVLVAIRAFSINRGELRRLDPATPRWTPGWVPGWDFSGTVVETRSARFAVGDHVVGTSPEGGGWAESIAVPDTQVASLDPVVRFSDAAALPVAGLTSLRMLRLAPLLGRRVLITGAAGGVGRIAVQLAHLGGAHVTALAATDERASGLAVLGADLVITSLEQDLGSFDLVLEGVGGASLARCATMLSHAGTLVMFGNSSNGLTTFDVRDVYLGRLCHLVAFTLPATYRTDPPARDLEVLAELLRRGVLDPQVSARATLDELEAALEQLRDRQVKGKLVIELPSP